MKTASRFLLCLLIALLFGISSIYANVAFHQPIRVVQPDGSTLEVFLCGDEYFHFFQTRDHVVVCPDAERHFYYARRNGNNLWEASDRLAHEPDGRTEPEKEWLSAQQAEQLLVNPAAIRRERMSDGGRPMLRGAQADPVKPVKGERKALVLLAQTKDVTFSSDDANAYYRRQFNESGFSDNGNFGSVRDYFIAQSDSLFKPSFDVFGPYTLSKPMSYYGENDASGRELHAHEMVDELCGMADADVNYRQYDGDGDGLVDFICVIYAGGGESYTGEENQIWPHSSTLFGLKLDGIWLWSYATSCELQSVGGEPKTDGIGAMCHEYSHVLGLMDTYDVDYTGNYGMYYWSLMAQGLYLNNGFTPCNYTAFEKESLGWTTIETIETESSLELKPLSEGGKAYRLVNEENPDECYVIENRQKENWDSYLPGHGLLVTHIDFDQKSWDDNHVNNHLPQGMTIVPADNSCMETMKDAAGDPYPGTSGNTSLSDFSLPAALMHTGDYLHKPLNDIQEKDGLITLKVMEGDVVIPKANEVIQRKPYAFTASWSMVYGSVSYGVEVYHILDVPEGTIPDVTWWNTNGVLQQTLSVRGYKCVVTGLEAGEWYAYRVRCVMQGSMSGYSSLVFVQLPEDEVDLPAPENLGTDSLWNVGTRLSWTPVEGADAYVVEVRRMEDSELFPEEQPQTLLNESFDGMSRAECLDISRVMDIYTDTLGWEGERVSGSSDGCAVLTSDKGEDERAYLCTPYIAQSEGHIFLLFSVRKFSENDPDLVLYLMMGNDSDDEYYVDGASIQVTSTEWKNWYAEWGPLSTNTYFTFLVQNGGRVCVDDVFTCFDYEEELDSPVCRMAVNPKTAQADTQTIHQKYTYIPTEETGMVFDNLPSSNYRFRVRSVKEEVYSPYSEALDVPVGNATFVIDGIRYQYISVEARTLRVLRNPLNVYSGDVVIPDHVISDGDTLEVKALADSLFRGCYELRSVTVPANVTMVGDNLFKGCRNLCYVDWNSVAAVPENSFVGVNPNCLLYVKGETTVSDASVQVVRDHHIGKLFLSPLSDFCAPEPFFADTAYYARRMDQKTLPHVSAGWETLSVPFDVDRIILGQNELHPFGSASGGPYFWLAQLGDKGFVSTHSIKAHIPYIISLPNSDCYAEGDRLNGSVYFMATQAAIESTTQRHTLSSGTFSMTPVYEWSESLSSDYVLNTYDSGIEGYYPGSLFYPGRMRAEPFSAVMHTTSKAPAFYPIVFASDHPSEEASESFQIFYQDGIPCFYGDASERKLPLFSSDGRVFRYIPTHPGLNSIGNLPSGLYFFQQRKIVIK